MENYINKTMKDKPTLQDEKIMNELEMRIIAFMTFIKVPLNSVNTIDLFNTFFNKVKKPTYIEQNLKDIQFISFIHETIEKYKNEDLFFRFDKEELLKYKPMSNFQKKN